MKAKKTTMKKSVKGTGGKPNPNKNIPSKAIPSAKYGASMKMGGMTKPKMKMGGAKKK